MKRPMKGTKKTTATLLAIAFGAVAHTAAREEVIRSIDWNALAAARALTSGVVVTTDGGKASNLRLAHKGPGDGTFHLVTIDRPAT